MRVLAYLRLGNHQLQPQLVKWLKDLVLKVDTRLCKLHGTADKDEEVVLLRCRHSVSLHPIVKP